MFTLGNAMENLNISALDEAEKKEFAVEIMRLYESILKIDEKFSLAHYKLGYIYKNFRQYKKAQLSFEKYLNLSDNDLRKQEVREVLNFMEADVLFEEAMLKIDANDFESALDYLLKIEPRRRNDLTYYNMSVSYMNLGDLESAKEAIDSAIQISDEAIYQNQLAMIAERDGDSESALKILKKAMDSFGDDYILNYNFATIQFNLGNIDAAIENFEKAYELKPSDELKNIIDFVKRGN